MLTGKTVFIVEDNSMNRVVYHMTLGKHGMFLHFDRWGRGSIARLNEVAHLDLIILDLMLPQGESGFTIFEKIRAIPQYDSIPVVAVSASEPAVAIPKAQKLGFSGFIAKPIDSLIFPKQIDRILDGENIWYTDV